MAQVYGLFAISVAMILLAGRLIGDPRLVWARVAARACDVCLSAAVPEALWPGIAQCKTGDFTFALPLRARGARAARALGGVWAAWGRARAVVWPHGVVVCAALYVLHGGFRRRAVKAVTQAFATWRTCYISGAILSLAMYSCFRLLADLAFYLLLGIGVICVDWGESVVAIVLRRDLQSYWQLRQSRARSYAEWRLAARALERWRVAPAEGANLAELRHYTDTLKGCLRLGAGARLHRPAPVVYMESEDLVCRVARWWLGDVVKFVGDCGVTRSAGEAVKNEEELHERTSGEQGTPRDGSISAVDSSEIEDASHVSSLDGEDTPMEVTPTNSNSQDISTPTEMESPPMNGSEYERWASAPRRERLAKLLALIRLCADASWCGLRDRTLFGEAAVQELTATVARAVEVVTRVAMHDQRQVARLTQPRGPKRAFTRGVAALRGKYKKLSPSVEGKVQQVAMPGGALTPNGQATAKMGLKHSSSRLECAPNFHNSNISSRGHNTPTGIELGFEKNKTIISRAKTILRVRWRDETRPKVLRAQTFAGEWPLPPPKLVRRDTVPLRDSPTKCSDANLRASDMVHKTPQTDVIENASTSNMHQLLITPQTLKSIETPSASDSDAIYDEYRPYNFKETPGSTWAPLLLFSPLARVNGRGAVRRSRRAARARRLEAEARAISETLMHVRLSVGRTAVALSGGGSWAMIHVGVLQELLALQCLPRVFSGASGGSIVAGMLAISSEAELRDSVLAPCVVERHAPHRWFPPRRSQLMNYWRTGALVDTAAFIATCRAYYGAWTFGEAFAHTRRIVSIVCSPQDGRTRQNSLILNYVTAPNVLIWSAVAASCALPGLMGSVELKVKHTPGAHMRAGQKWFHSGGAMRSSNRDASEKGSPHGGSQNHRTPTTPSQQDTPPKHSHPNNIASQKTLENEESYCTFGRRWIDGSLQSDIPSAELRALFNTKTVVVSQVNPHAKPFVRTPRGRAASYADVLRDARAWLMVDVRARHIQLAALSALPAALGRALGSPWRLQKYHGDFTLVPETTFKDFPLLLKNPSLTDMERLIQLGRRAAWPYLESIKHLSTLEIALRSSSRAIGYHYAVN